MYARHAGCESLVVRGFRLTYQAAFVTQAAKAAVLDHVTDGEVKAWHAIRIKFMRGD